MILAVRNYLKGRKIYANYKLNFPFEPVRTPDQIENMNNGFFAADERIF